MIRLFESELMAQTHAENGGQSLLVEGDAAKLYDRDVNRLRRTLRTCGIKSIPVMGGIGPVSWVPVYGKPLKVALSLAVRE